MKKAIVINELKSTNTELGCTSWFTKPDANQQKIADIKTWENSISKKFNNLSQQGYRLIDERIYNYNVKDLSDKSNITNTVSSHGVYFFEQDSKSNTYKTYIGPLIVLPKQSSGCNVGCNDFKKLGCKKTEKKDKAESKSLGCNSPKITGEQYINFYNNEINSENVKAINKLNNWRTNYKQDRDDYVYSLFESSNDLVNAHWDLIQKQIDSDLSEIFKSGLGFLKSIPLPNEDNIFTNALVFSTETASNKIKINKTSSLKAYLNAFELLYLKPNSNFLKIIIDLIKKLLGIKTPSVVKTSITEENITRLEEVYNFNISQQEQIINEIEATRLAIVGKLRVVLAVPVSQSSHSGFGILGFLFKNKPSYSYISVDIDLNKA